MHELTILLSNCIYKEELLNGGEPLYEHKNALHVFVVRTRSVVFDYLQHNLAGVKTQAKEIALCANHLTEGAKFTCTRRSRPALKAL